MHRSIRAVLYDHEAWALTPTAEQRDVMPYLQRFRELAHAHGYEAILTPATDLMNVYRKNQGETNQQAFVRYGTGQAARDADLFEVQAQTLEQTPAAYASYVEQVHAQAVAANSDVVFLSGLTARLHGTTISAQQLYGAAMSVSGAVRGFFLNVPRDPPHPAHAVEFLRRLLAEGYGRRLR
jgi:hypothetical protein